MTYSVGRGLSGVGVYSRELARALAAQHPDEEFRWYYRPHRFLKSLREKLPAKARRRLLLDNGGSRKLLFHGLNQRLPARPFSKQIATFHDLFVMTAQYSTPEFRARFTRQAREAAAAADLIITVSQFTASQVTALLGVEPARIRVVYHGIQPLPVYPRAPEKMVLHVGVIQERKNIARLVKAFEAVPADWTLVLAGSSGYGAEKILDAIEHSPRRARIFVTGYISDRDLARYYARAGVFAFPSLDEGFGMPVLEAMRAGVAVVASHSSAIPEVCGSSAKLIDPENTESLAETLQALTNNMELRRKYEELGKERAKEFSWARAADQTWAAYRELS